MLLLFASLCVCVIAKQKYKTHCFVIFLGNHSDYCKRSQSKQVSTPEVKQCSPVIYYNRMIMVQGIDFIPRMYRAYLHDIDKPCIELLYMIIYSAAEVDKSYNSYVPLRSTSSTHYVPGTARSFVLGPGTTDEYF